MGRADRRRFDKEYKRLLRTDGDNCSFCRRPLQHNDKTFGGYDVTGSVAVGGECCRGKMREILCSGLFMTRNTDPFTGKDGTPAKPVPAEQIENLVQAMHDRATGIDLLSQDLMRRAGLTGHSQNISFADTPWKTDDANWFQSNPQRSHRLRPLFEGESESMGSIIGRVVVPPKHRLEVLVRQIEVGKRVRTLFCHNTEISVPDVEEVVHALYDTVSQPGRAGVISVQEITDLTAKYRDATTGKTQ